MPKKVSVRTDKDHQNALQAMQDNGDADSFAEAMRQTSRTELARRGYLKGHNGKTSLRLATQEISKLFLYIALATFAFTYFFPIQLRILTFAPLASGLFLVGVDRALARVEPTVTNRINAIFTRGKA